MNLSGSLGIAVVAPHVYGRTAVRPSEKRNRYDATGVRSIVVGA